MIERRLIAVEGIVQGVGFRPFVHELATRLALHGSVRNAASGVSIDVEGDQSALDAFIHSLTTSPPPLAVIERMTFERTTTATAWRGFQIAPSDGVRSATAALRVAPDLATCDACVRDLFDPANRRYRYAFLSCSQCGPRLTIAHGAPWDRERTTMRDFVMCEACRREYLDATDRRFHAQTIACEHCGPRLRLNASPGQLEDEDVVGRAAAALRDGGIVAVKGIGGFHLACDATNAVAVRRLRLRKHREAKPLAVMVRDIEAAAQRCELSPTDTQLLTSRQRPIVLLRKREGSDLADEVAPGNRRLGVMLPYTPLHHLLLAEVRRPLVMTSGNVSDEPIAFRDEDALERLAGIADLFVLHDREIATRCDDSVIQVSAGAPRFVRRSRGHAPAPIPLAAPASVPALGMGGHLKNTFCLISGQSAFVSHHVGDLETASAVAALDAGLQHYASLVGVQPEIVAHDLHPDYRTTAMAMELAAQQGIERVAVQHHHAHILSCVAEHRVTGPVLGVAFDGTGYGTDGAIWGGEFLVVDGASFERLAHLSYVPLPGGDAAIRHPWRSALAHCWSAFGNDWSGVPEALLADIDPAQVRVMKQLLERPHLSPRTSSMGRLFDAIAALVGCRATAQFEAQAAMELEMLSADPSHAHPYDVGIDATSDGWTIDAGAFVRGVVNDLAAGKDRRTIATTFHASVCHTAARMVAHMAARTGIRRVALSGGAFQNTLLTECLATLLTRDGFDVLIHERVPCNDGGLSLGQACAAVLHHARGT